MFLEKKKSPNGRVFLTIKQGYRDKDGKSRSRVVKKLGYLDVLEKEYDDPISVFTAQAKSFENLEKAQNKLDVHLYTNERIIPGESNLKNYGYIVLSCIYHELELDRFFNNKRIRTNFEYNSEAIARLLCYARVIYPNSKRETLRLKDRFFDNFDFSLDDIYNCLGHFNDISNDAQKHIHNKISEIYGRDTCLTYYDVTNFYFETDVQDNLRKLGYSKEHRRNPIIQMGMAIDNNGIPMGYKLYPGNTHDSETYIPAISQIKKDYDVGRIVVVADKGLNSGDNIVFSSALGDGYVFSQRVSGGDADIKSFVLDPRGYTTPTKEGFRIKSRVQPVTVKITGAITKSGKKSKKPIQLEYQKQIIFYSPKYAQRAKRKRNEALQKAAELVKDPSKYSRATHYGAAAYVRNFSVDKDTGEIIQSEKTREINMDKVREEEKFDGYYAIVTSEINESDERIVDMYRGLWRIEETFMITKSVLLTRPAFVYDEQSIGGHFLVCFIALIMLRLIEFRLGYRFCVEAIANTLRSVTCTHLTMNQYLFNYASDITEAINDEFGLDIGKKYMSTGEIRSSFGTTKKHINQGGRE